MYSNRILLIKYLLRCIYCSDINDAEPRLLVIDAEPRL